jgi:hypothetical protein
VRRDLGHCGHDVRHTGRYRDRNGQDVVDEQGGGGDQGGVSVEVGPADGVGAAAVRIGVAGLPVRGDDDDEQQQNCRGDPGRQVQECEPAEAQHQQDLLGGVCVGRQRVAAEHRERQLLREQRVAESFAAQGSPHEESFGHGHQVAHSRTLRLAMPPRPGPNTILTRDREILTRS